MSNLNTQLRSRLAEIENEKAAIELLLETTAGNGTTKTAAPKATKTKPRRSGWAKYKPRNAGHPIPRSPLTRAIIKYFNDYTQMTSVTLSVLTQKMGEACPSILKSQGDNFRHRVREKVRYLEQKHGVLKLDSSGVITRSRKRI